MYWSYISGFSECIMSILISPSFDKKTDLYYTFREKGMFFLLKEWAENELLYNSFNPEVRDIFIGIPLKRICLQWVLTVGGWMLQNRN